MMEDREDYLERLLAEKRDIHSKEVVQEMQKIGIQLSEEPYKLYGLTYDGNGNECDIFIGAFPTIEAAEKEVIDNTEFHGRTISLEEDY